MKKSIYLLILMGFSALVFAFERSWKPLAKDNIHDLQSPAVEVLQEPATALSILPPDSAGNKVDWVRALREGYIEPRTNILPGTYVMEVLDNEIIMDRTGEMPLVLFPHRPHTEWLECRNCHNEIFVDKVDANPINMLAILQGEYCGRCHGAVAFPLTECNRCHSVNRNTFTGEAGVQPQKRQVSD